MKAYKIKHIPTGLYFTPSRESGNFSKNGKMYPKPPSLKWLDHIMRVKIYFRGDNPSPTQQKIIDHFSIVMGDSGFYDKYFKVPLDHWVIEEL